MDPVKKGHMLQVLFEFEEKILPTIFDKPEVWRTLDVNYEPPRVERLWYQQDEYRVYLHRIHPCTEALFHPHPWPSAVRILSGCYEMGVGYGAGTEPPPEAASVVLFPGSYYEMVDPNGWHYVRPIQNPSISIMVTGEPWGRLSPGKNIDHKFLSNETRDEILFLARSHFRVARWTPVK